MAAATALQCAVHGDDRSRALAVGALIDALPRAPRDLAIAILETLGDLAAAASPAVDAAIRQLAHPDPVVRYGATFALGRIGAAARTALPELERLQKDPFDGPRYGALDAIKRIASP